MAFVNQLKLKISYMRQHLKIDINYIEKRMQINTPK